MIRLSHLIYDAVRSMLPGVVARVREELRRERYGN